MDHLNTDSSSLFHEIPKGHAVLLRHTAAILNLDHAHTAIGFCKFSGGFGMNRMSDGAPNPSWWWVDRKRSSRRKEKLPTKYKRMPTDVDPTQISCWKSVTVSLIPWGISNQSTPKNNTHDEVIARRHLFWKLVFPFDFILYIFFWIDCTKSYSETKIKLYTVSLSIIHIYSNIPCLRYSCPRGKDIAFKPLTLRHLDSTKSTQPHRSNDFGGINTHKRNPVPTLASYNPF